MGASDDSRIVPSPEIDVLNRETEQTDLIQWHSQLAAIMKYVFSQSAAPGTSLRGLRVDRERAPGEDPWRGDLVVEKPDTVHLLDPLGRKFKARNLLEFKSADISLSLKVLAHTFAAGARLAEEADPVDEILPEDITLTLLGFRTPTKLFQLLERRGASVSENDDAPGVYDVSGVGLMTTQIVLIPKFTEAMNSDHHGLKWLRWLRRDLSVDEGRAMLNKLRQIGDSEKRDVMRGVARTVLLANSSVADELEGDNKMDAVMEEVLGRMVRKKFSAELQEKDDQIKDLGDQIREKDGQIRDLGDEVKQKDKLIMRLLTRESDDK